LNQINSQDFLPGGAFYNPVIASTHSGVVNNSRDPILSTLMHNIVHKGSHSLRIEDYMTGGFLSIASQRIDNYFCDDIYFAWLAVLQDGGHNDQQSGLVIVELKDLTQNVTLIQQRYAATNLSAGSDPGFSFTSVSGSMYYYNSNWRVEHLPIGVNRRGHNFSLNVLAADCQGGAHLGYVYLDSFGGVAP
jgi:hypothetical protein